MCSIIRCLAATSLCVAGLYAQTHTKEQLAAAARIYFRDSTEIPLNVAVVTTVRNLEGKSTKTSKSTVQVLFKGYSIDGHRFSFAGNSGWFNTGALRDSFPGNFAAFDAAALIADQEDYEVRVEPGAAYSKTKKCDSKLEMNRNYLMPKTFCLEGAFKIGSDAHGGPTFEHFAIDIGKAPAAAKLPYLGEVQVTSYRAEGNFQESLLAGDPKPFLLPGQITTVIATNKGTLTITNTYSMQAAKKK